MVVAGAVSARYRDAELRPQIQRHGRTSADGRDFGRTEVGSDGETLTRAASTQTQQLLTFAVVGDFGTGTQTQHDVAQRMCRWRGGHPYDLVLTTGDNIYPRGEPHLFRAEFKRPYACLLRNGVRFRSTLGNHDVLTRNGRPELDDPAFGMPRRNYVFRRAGVRFVMANSNNLSLDWLRDAVRPQEGDLYTIVVMHHPVYSPGAHGSTPGFRPDLPRIFERHGVDLVLNGHDHLYSVTKPLDDIRYAVTGGGGAPLYKCNDRWFVEVCRSRHHFLFVSVTTDWVAVRAVPAFGRVFDTFRVPAGV